MQQEQFTSLAVPRLRRHHPAKVMGPRTRASEIDTLKGKPPHGRHAPQLVACVGLGLVRSPGSRREHLPAERQRNRSPIRKSDNPRITPDFSPAWPGQDPKQSRCTSTLQLRQSQFAKGLQGDLFKQNNLPYLYRCHTAACLEAMAD